MLYGRSIVRAAKNYSKGYSDAQIKTRAATNNDPWGPSGAQMHELAQMSYISNDFVDIMEMLDKRLSDTGKNWKHVYKSLVVVEYLSLAGSENVVLYFRDNIYVIKTLQEFQYRDENSRDQGANVRKKAKELYDLLVDESRLRTERRARRDAGSNGQRSSAGEDVGAQQPRPTSGDMDRTSEIATVHATAVDRHGFQRRNSPVTALEEEEIFQRVAERLTALVAPSPEAAEAPPPWKADGEQPIDIAGDFTQVTLQNAYEAELDETSGGSGVSIPHPPPLLDRENEYLLFILRRIISPTLTSQSTTLFQNLSDVVQSSSMSFQDVARQCTQIRDPRGRTAADYILCSMQEVHERCEAPWYDNKTGFTGRMLLKFSQSSRAVPSTLFVEDVSYTDKTPVGGMGSFADVFRGTRLGRGVALKRLRISVYKDEQPEKWHRMLFREALMWRQLRHPCILAFIGLDKKSFPGTLCMVSPWMDNGDMATYLRAQPDVDVGRKAKWLQQIATGMSYLHQERVVHGDLRGANILLDENLDTYISDFGMSFFMGAGTLTMGLTSFKEGAKRWMAPEVLETGQCTAEGDVYSFGCLCLEIVCGEIPFTDLPADTQMFRAVLSGKMPVWPDSADGFQREMGKLVVRCWSGDVATRPAMISLQKSIPSLAYSSNIT